MAETTIGNPLTPPGIITESGGEISLFTDQSVDIGIGRIFTLRGGDVVIWSSKGDIAAGSSSRTVQSAPPTRVVIDPQSAAVETDLAGLATGGGIGVLATVEGVEPGDVDLIAPDRHHRCGRRRHPRQRQHQPRRRHRGECLQHQRRRHHLRGSIHQRQRAERQRGHQRRQRGRGFHLDHGQSRPGTAADCESTKVRPRNPSSIYTVEVIGYGGGAAEEEDDEGEGEAGGPEEPAESSP